MYMHVAVRMHEREIPGIKGRMHFSYIFSISPSLTALSTFSGVVSSSSSSYATFIPPRPINSRKSVYLVPVLELEHEHG